MTNYKSYEIAIIGMSGRFPGADNIEELWDNLKEAKESISFFNKEELVGIDNDLLENPHYIKAQGILKNIKRFDAKFFACTPREAETMDPQHRIFLECAWEALENAGYSPKIRGGNNIGVYAGTGENNYLQKNVMPTLESSDTATEFQLIINNSKDFLSTRIAYKLNLTGPAITIQTACSTALVAVHQACIALQMGECEMALAGAVSFLNLEKTGYLYQPGMILSPDGKCRAFDASAQGTVGGQGAGIVVLKPAIKAIEDGDHIYAIIKSSAINNDGSDKMGFTAPSPHQQAEVIKKAYQKAKVSPETITYIEAHGTGTPLGDPIEVSGLTMAFNTDKKQFCAIGSIKSNLGHLDVAAGIVGLIKTALCLYHKTLVPSLHYITPNPQIKFIDTPFYVNTELKHWESTNTPRRAGVSSFGVGGTNAHILLEESPRLTSSLPKNEYQLINLSANTEASLNKATESLSHCIIDNNLENIAYTLHTGKRRFKYNRFIVCKSKDEFVEYSKEKSKEFITNLDGEIVFMFPGQGSQYRGMGSYLYNNDPAFKCIVDKCLLFIKNIIPFNSDPNEFLGLTDQVNQTAITQPALFIIEYSLAQYLINLGIKPDAMIGHSIGEYVAACISGVLRLEDALQLVLMRGQLLQSLPEGKMLSILLSEGQILTYLKNYNLDIAAVNTKDNCVVAGACQEISKFAKQLDDHQIPYKYLNTSHAFHSHMLEPILTTFHSYLNKIKMSPPTIPYISNLTGHWIEKHQATTSEYWVDHLRKTILFANGLDCLWENRASKNKIFLEVGPGTALTNLAKKHLRGYDNKFLLLPLLRSQKSTQNERENLLNTLGNLYAAGVNVNWPNFYTNKLRRIPLPTYHFEETEYWISSKESTAFKKDNIYGDTSPSIQSKSYTIKGQNTHHNQQENCSLLQKEIINIWQDILGISKVDPSDDFFQLGGDSLQAIQINRKINTHFNLNITLKNVLENSKLSRLSAIIQEKLDLLKSPSLKNDTLSTSSIIKLKDGKEKSPLFVIHPIDGYVFCYREMSRHVTSDRMVYGIQSPWFEEGVDASSLTTIESLATYYVKSILALNPIEPISLFGSSFGGLVAYEVAQQLENKGYKVSLLSMADIARPNHPLLKVSDVQNALVKIIELFKGELLTTLDYAGLSSTERVKLLLESMNFQNLPSWQHQKMFDQVSTFCQAMINYHPKPYYGKVIFFDASMPILESSSLRASSTWKEFILKNSKIYEIPGNHFSMLEKPNIAALVQLLELHIVDLD